MSEPTIDEVVRARYGEAAAKVRQGEKKTSCCGGSAGDLASAVDPITRDLYHSDQLEGLPEQALLASLGCGNPTALAELHAGETVLDLGSGGGVDVLLSGRRVGPTGRAYGVDMTDEMLALANENKARAGAENVEFLKGTIDAVPLPDDSIDVLISNCVINLAADKAAVLREAARLLRPAGRFAVSDIVLERELPAEVQRCVALWTGCVAGALLRDEYQRLLEAAGFLDVSFEITRRYGRDDLAEMARSVPADQGGPESVLARLDELEGAVASAFIRARRP